MAPQAGVNGVLPIPMAAGRGNANSAPRGPKATQPKLKLVLRRLPPGLTKAEFEAAIGDEWKQGAGKVDWLVFKKGNISKDLAKPSRPARAYLHVTSQAHVMTLGDHVRATTFKDAAKSDQDSALIGPPTLEYAPYHRMPGGRRKHDTRQGTIDQDQEFKDFLESLTNPITKPAAAEADGQKEGKVKTTPLIEALREKKALKEKPQPKTARQGRGEAKEDAAEKPEKKILSKGGKDAAPSSGEKGRRPTKAERAAKEAVKVLNKEASASKDASTAGSEKSATPSPAPERKRGNASAVKSMLQRDLGLAPAPTRRRGTKREVGPASTPTPTQTAQPEPTPAVKAKAKEAPAVAAAVAASDKSVPASPKKTSRAERRAFKATLVDRTNSKNNGEEQKTQPKAAMPAPTILKKPQTNPAPTPPRGPAASRAPPTEPAASRAQSHTKAESAPSRPQQPAHAPATSSASTSMGRSAFLKHANPSQGITEPLIEEALKVFGAIEKVEIDKRKGFAYVEFAESDGLRKAIAASPVKVAQGAVQVLEKKEKVVRTRPHPGPHPGPHTNAHPNAHTGPHNGPHGPPTGPARGGRGGFAGRGGRGRGGARGGAHGAPGAAGGEGTPAPSAPAPVPAAASSTTNTAT